MTEPEDDEKSCAQTTPASAEDLADREAILRRRARFVASAMAGLVLGGANACSDPGTPQACLSPAPLEPQPTSTAAPSTGPSSDVPPASLSSEVPPQPCLDVPPQPCLRYAAPPDAGTASAGPSSSAPPPLPPSTNPYPAPCLKMVRPPEPRK